MILVTGATGFIGGHLLRALTARDGNGDGPGVRALVRSDVTLPGVETVRGDLADPDSLRRAAAGVDLVYHLAGPYRGSPTELDAAHVAGTANLLGALDPGARLVLVSSTSVYGWDQAWPADHDTPPAPSSAYGRAKLAAERLAQAWPGGEVVVARPTITYGPGDERGMLARVVGLMARGIRRFPGTGANRVHLLHVDDLVRGLLHLGGAGDGVFVFGGPVPAPIRHVLELLAQGAGLPPPSFGLPPALLRSLSTSLETAWAAAGFDGDDPLTRHSLDVATRDRAYSWARAAEVLGWRPLVTLEKGVPAEGAELIRARRAGRASTPVSAPGTMGFDWKGYVDDPDEGLGTVYERFALDDVLQSAVERTGATSVLHAPLFGMMGFPGLDAVFLAQRGLRVGLLDFDADRMAAVVAEWHKLGLDPETHLVSSPDPARWPTTLGADYDLVFSFAALWWFDQPDEVVAASARWASRGVLCCVPNKNVFMRLRALLWHRQLFEELNEDALVPALVRQAGVRAGLRAVDSGLFDIPPFPDTSVPLAKVLRARLNRSPAGDTGQPEQQAWSWSILPYLAGDDPGMKDRVAKLARWEPYLPGPVRAGLAHHHYVLFATQTT